MDQKELRELEKRCIQEEPPFCTAACPLHVDVRLFLKLMAEGKPTRARKILDKTMPFPGILGRICDHPCETRCRLGEKGAPIAVGDVERACVTHTASTGKTMKLPPREQSVAVLGSGLSSLTAALDLVKKGYKVAIFDKAAFPGGSLLDIPPSRLPRTVIMDGVKELEKLGVCVDLNTRVDKYRLEGLREEYHAIYVGFDGYGGTGLDVFPVGEPAGTTAVEGVFAGGAVSGDMKPGESPGSPVVNAAQGRWAAVSMDRFLQKVSMTAGREKEGPLDSELHTDMKDVAPLPRVPMESGETGYTEQEARNEASRCIQCECMECVKVCPYLEKYKGYPRQYARQIYNNQSIVKGARTANKMINSCSLCRLCETVCPNDFSMADLCHATRREMVAEGKMPPSAHEFALLDMASANSEPASLARHAPGESRSTHLFFPGCQLGGASPDHVGLAYAYLREHLDPKTGLMLGCCGAPAHWGGDDKLLESVLDRMRASWTEMGKPKLITACSSCQSVFDRFFPEAEVVSLWSVMADKGLPQTALNTRTKENPVAIVDPCTARHETAVQESVRDLLKGMGAAFEELELSRELTECCGFGGLMSNADPDVTRELLARRADQSPLDYVSYCIVCRDHLASTGKTVGHILDYIWPENKTESPGYSMRMENRRRLRSGLLEKLWDEESEDTEAYRKIRLEISPEVLERIEGRRILKEDIQKTLLHVQNGGKWLKNPKTGNRLAFHRPLKVTFWVEYREEGDSFVIYNAYCHRMTTAGGE